MTMQRRPNNPIEASKQAVRKHSRNGLISVGAGVGGGVLMTILFGNPGFWLVLGLVVAVVGGAANFLKVRKIINQNYNNY